MDEYREKIAALEKELVEAKAKTPSEEEVNALKLKNEGISLLSFYPQNSFTKICFPFRTSKTTKRLRRKFAGDR